MKQRVRASGCVTVLHATGQTKFMTAVTAHRTQHAVNSIQHILYRLFYTVHVACKQAACTAQTVPCMQRPARCLWQSDTRLAQLHVLFPVLMAYLVLRRKCTRTCIRARMHASITANKV